MKQKRLAIVVYIVSILTVNLVFLYLRTLEAPDQRKTITLFHVLFGTIQLVYLLPKIIRMAKGGQAE